MKNHIEERRKARGMTQQQLASELGVSRQTIISLENGKYNPSILLAHSIARRGASAARLPPEPRPGKGCGL